MDSSTDTSAPAGAVTAATASLLDFPRDSHSLNGDTYLLPADELLASLQQLRDEQGFDLLLDIIGVDYLAYPGHRAERFGVVYLLLNRSTQARLRLKVLIHDHC